MKRLVFIVLTVVLAFVLSTVTPSQNSTYSHSSQSYRTIENNYLKGLESGNQGIKISCAFYLGEMKSKRAVVPLMKMMSIEEHEGARIIAAWSLMKIGDPRGIYRVRKESETSDCCSVQCMCEYLYKQYLNVPEPKVTEAD